MPKTDSIYEITLKIINEGWDGSENKAFKQIVKQRPQGQQHDGTIETERKRMIDLK